MHAITLYYSKKNFKTLSKVLQFYTNQNLFDKKYTRMVLLYVKIQDIELKKKIEL